MIKAIIIDDEAKARRMLEALLKEYCPDVAILAIAEDVPSGVIAINQHKPDVVFLDVEMPGYTGFQLLDFFREVNFEIVFTTAHSDYAF
jgi:two-component system LytT family response regulator